MAVVWIPALLRDLTDGQAQVTAPGLSGHRSAAV